MNIIYTVIKEMELLYGDLSREELHKKVFGISEEELSKVLPERAHPAFREHLMSDKNSCDDHMAKMSVYWQYKYENMRIKKPYTAD